VRHSELKEETESSTWQHGGSPAGRRRLRNSIDDCWKRWHAVRARPIDNCRLAGESWGCSGCKEGFFVMRGPDAEEGAFSCGFRLQRAHPQYSSNRRRKRRAIKGNDTKNVINCARIKRGGSWLSLGNVYHRLHPPFTSNYTSTKPGAWGKDVLSTGRPVKEHHHEPQHKTASEGGKGLL